MSCLLEDIDPISKIFKILLKGSSALFGTCLFQNCQNVGSPKTVCGFSGFFVGVMVSPKMNIIGFRSRGHVQKLRNHRNEEFEVLP